MKNKQMVWGALLSYGTIAFNILAGFLYTPWMIHTIGDEQYALYTLAISVINIFLLDFGISSAVSKFLSNYYAREQYSEADRFMSVVFKVFLGISAVIAACLLFFFFFIDTIYTKLGPDNLQVFKKLYVLVATYSVLTFPGITLNGVMMANEQFIAIKSCGFGQKLMSVCLIVVSLCLGGNIYALVAVNAVSNVVFLVIKYICIRKGTSLKIPLNYWNRDIARSLFHYSAWVTIGNIAGRFIFNIMPSLITANVGAVAVTVFGLASALEGYVFTFSESINGMFLPRIAKIVTEDNEKTELSMLMNKVGFFHVLTIGLIYVGFLCLGREFVELWMGDGYNLVYDCAVLLIFPSLLDVPQQIAKTALLAKDIVKEQALIYVGMAATNLILSAKMIPTFGVVGAAASICCAFILRTICFNVLYYKRLPVNLPKYFKNTYGRWSIGVVLTFVIGRSVADIEWSGWGGLFMKIVLICFAYVILMLSVGVQNGWKLLLSALRKIRSE